MARTSRKNISNANVQGNGSAAVLIQPERIFHAAAYIRLSVEDNHYSKDCESIEMQQYMVEKFIVEQPDMILYKAYVDNGETGTNFERPGFEEMMEDVRGRAVDCIVVKDLSRFGRNYVETGYYLEKIFPYLDVRFIALNDGYDTLKGDGNELVLSLKNLINDFYAKDISRKICSSLDTKRRNGEFIGAFAPFGYRKSPEDKHKLIPDPESAAIVREIFERRLNGEGFTGIAQSFNTAGIQNPVVWRYRNGWRKKEPNDRESLWRAATVRKITESPVYLGHMAQGKQKTSLSQGICRKVVEKDDWILVENTHEPIVAQEIFDKVNELAEQTRQEYKRNCAKNHDADENIFRGVIFCKDCGTTMNRIKDNKATRAKYNYVCRVAGYDKYSCTHKRVGLRNLEDCVLESLRIQIGLAQELEKKLKHMEGLPAYREKRKELTEEIKSMRQKMKRNAMLKGSLFEAYSGHVLDREEYLSMKGEYEEESEKLKDRLEKLENEEKNFLETFSAGNKWIAELKKYRKLKELTSEIVHTLIKRINVSGYNEIEIVWNFQDEFNILSGMVERGH